MIEVVDTGALLTIQDLGRPGHASLGVSLSGAVDRRALRRANVAVGNRPGAAGLETTLTGAVLRALAPLVVAVTGADASVFVGDVPVRLGRPLRLATGQVLEVGAAVDGARSYVAVRGGIDAAPVLGSRSTDVLSGIGPAPLAAGDRLLVGPSAAPDQDLFAAPSTAFADLPGDGPTLRLLPGPRADWLADPGALRDATFTASPRSNRVGLRLEGDALERARDDELASEGIVAGAVQLPPSGLPVVFLADHPTTGGYPVIGVLASASLALAAQTAPGTQVRFTLA